MPTRPTPESNGDVIVNGFRLPHAQVETLERYVDRGIPPGSFVLAVLENDLRTACERADLQNRHCLWGYVAWLYNYAPAGCWGSPEAVAFWLAYQAAIKALPRQAEKGGAVAIESAGAYVAALNLIGLPDTPASLVAILQAATLAYEARQSSAEA